MLLTHALKTILFVFHHQCFWPGSGRPAGWRHVDNIVCFCVASVLDWVVVCLGAMRILLFALHRECLDRKVGWWGYKENTVLDQYMRIIRFIWVSTLGTIYKILKKNVDLICLGGGGVTILETFYCFFVHVLGHFEQFGGVLFFYYFGGLGHPRTPPPPSVENSN